jgi:hypothetical protein
MSMNDNREKNTTAAILVTGATGIVKKERRD